MYSKAQVFTTPIYSMMTTGGRVKAKCKEFCRNQLKNILMELVLQKFYLFNIVIICQWNGQKKKGKPKIHHEMFTLCIDSAQEMVISIG